MFDRRQLAIFQGLVGVVKTLQGDVRLNTSFEKRSQNLLERANETRLYLILKLSQLALVQPTTTGRGLPNL